MNPCFLPSLVIHPLGGYHMTATNQRGRRLMHASSETHEAKGSNMFSDCSCGITGQSAIYPLTHTRAPRCPRLLNVAVIEGRVSMPQLPPRDPSTPRGWIHTCSSGLKIQSLYSRNESQHFSMIRLQDFDCSVAH